MFRCADNEPCPYRAESWSAVVEHLERQHGITDDAAPPYVKFMPPAEFPWVTQWQHVSSAAFRLKHPLPQWDPAWPCDHCQATLTLPACLFTPNHVGPEGQAEHPGDLTCPHCATSVLETFTRLHRAFVMADDPETNDDPDDPDDEP